MTTTFAHWGVTGHLWNSSLLEMVKMPASLQWSELILTFLDYIRLETGIFIG